MSANAGPQFARRRLEGGATVAEAAYGVGCQDAANFSTAFKRRFGVAPKHVHTRFD